MAEALDALESERRFGTFLRAVNLGVPRLLGRQSDREMDREFRRNRELREAVAEHVREQVGEGATFLDILKWIMENQESIIAFIKAIMALFVTV